MNNRFNFRGRIQVLSQEEPKRVNLLQKQTSIHGLIKRDKGVRFLHDVFSNNPPESKYRGSFASK